jgi:probable F420-dependent oxidoreductase
MDECAMASRNIDFGACFLAEYPSKIAGWARLAEDSGFGHIWFVDSHVLWMEIYQYMLMCALNTKKATVGPMVTNPVTRLPSVTASGMATLNELSGGRAVLGIGRGDSAVREMGLKPATLKQFEDGVTEIKKIASGKEHKYDGKPFRIKWLTKKTFPIYVAAYGPKLLDFAGKFADGVILQAADPSIVKWSIDIVRKSAREAGRDPRKLHFVVAATSYVSKDIKKARDECRYYAGVVANHVLDLLTRYKPEQLPPELVKDMDVFRGRYDYDEHCKPDAKHSRYSTDDMVDRLTIVGDVDACSKRIETLKEIGVTQVALYLFGGDKAYLIKTYGRRIIPQFRSS